MKWVNACLKNRLAIYVAAIAICLLGLFCLYIVPIAPFPPNPGDRIIIQYRYPGANANTAQQQITTKVATALKSVTNVQNIATMTRAGKVNIDLRLINTKTNALLKTQIQVMQALASVHLPAAVPQPTIRTTGGTSGLVGYIIASNKLNTFQINNFVQSTLYPLFSSFSGADVWYTSSSPVIKIKLSPEKIAAYHLNLNDITTRINESYRSIPLGSLYLNQQSYLLSMSGDITSLFQLKNLVIGYRYSNKKATFGLPIYLGDIATVTFEPRNIIPKNYASFNGKQAGLIMLYTLGVANPFSIAKVTASDIKQLKSHLPSGMSIKTLYNTATTLHASINEVIFTICIASILVLLIALIFLGRLRTTLIPIATIPICLLGTVIFVTTLGYSLNILTLLAMVISVGLVVDDAIVVVENITRYIEKGMTKTEAVLHGTTNIALTIIAITSVLLATFLPIVFSSGNFITYLKAFAVPLAAAVFISGIVALTLTPVMSTFLISDAPPNHYQEKFSTLLHASIAKYQILLNWFLKHMKWALLIIIGLISVGAFYGLKLPKTYFPNDPANRINIILTGTPQDTINTLREKTKQFKKFYLAKTVDFYSLHIKDNAITGKLTAYLQIHYLPKYLHQDVIFNREIQTFIQKNNIKNASSRVLYFSNEGDDPDLSFYIYGNNTQKINGLAKALTTLMKRNKNFTTVSNTINQPKKQIEFVINTIKAAKLGIYRSDIAQLLSTYYGGYQINNNFNIAGLSVPVMIILNNRDLKNPQSIQKLQIQSSITDQYYPLSDFVTLKTVAKPVMISTFHNQPSVMINANFGPGYTLAKAIPFVNQLIVHRMPGLHYQYTGNAKQYLKGSYQTILILVLGLISVYFLLAILFNSLLDPFIIMLTVPFTIVGGMLSLYLVDGTINLYSSLGLITLIGLITKHGVLIVKFANDQLEKGASVREAILTATHHRFRPIIMTTLAMTMGALPLLLSQQLMYIAREDLGIVIIGGLLIGTFFSLFIVPVVYTLVKRNTLPRNASSNNSMAQ